ncbi:hypothetical protein BT96DRAFT_933954 [Gymnopus androsaceus JB14]|uniref:Uncharacterized protein n=1 Tax=Gymnopus androsaceus JB14 TaxID=1447944 RepID=A0A6A4I7U4_9AGAR|nr:hypothetical protein BT96DRAFT_933954 [Gymnopus androsaceus JB14]
MSSSPSRRVRASLSSLSKRDPSDLDTLHGMERDNSDDDSSSSTSTSTTSTSTSSRTRPTQSQHGGQNQGINSPKKSNAGAVAGGVIAALLVVLAILAYLWWRRRRSRRDRPKAKLEIDPMSSLNGQLYPRRSATKKDEEQSLIRRSSTIVANFNPPPTHPQFWQVQNLNDTDSLHEAPLIPRNIPGSEKKVAISDTHKAGDKPGSSSSVPPVPEKDTFRQPFASSSKLPSSSEKASFSGTGNKPAPPDDAPGPSAWKEKAKLKEVQPLDDSSSTEDTASPTSSRRFSQLEANDLALAAKEEVSDLRRHVSLLKQANAELVERPQESPPAYNE